VPLAACINQPFLPPSSPCTPPPRAQGSLWDWYRQLYREGWQLDCNSYSTCFRSAGTARLGRVHAVVVVLLQWGDAPLQQTRHCRACHNEVQSLLGQAVPMMADTYYCAILIIVYCMDGSVCQKP
jgi:hypothetical protein